MNALRRAVDARPTDAATRLVYADWLDDAGLDSLARCQRWLVALNRRPKRWRPPHAKRHTRYKFYWRVFSHGNLAIATLASLTPFGATYYLTPDLFRHLKRDDPKSITSALYTTAAEAEAALALSLDAELGPPQRTQHFLASAS